MKHVLRWSVVSRRWSVLVFVIALLALPSLAHAGGWAVVTLDALPTDVRPDQPFTVGFVVRQHGIHPNSQLSPVITATDGKGTVKTFQARAEGAEGHYVAELTLPAGSWEWQIDAFYPLAHMGTLEVAPAAPAASAASRQSQSVPTRWLWVAGIALVVFGSVRGEQQRRRALA
jgi:hypothetical protein